MPQSYLAIEPVLPTRQRSYSSSSSSSSSLTVPPPLPVDPDDSILLSDLVRSGEASRLRRRGAMRIDHSSAAARSDRPSGWDSVYDIDVIEVQLGRNNSFRNRRRQRSRRYGPYGSGTGPQQDESDEYVYTLVCGAECPILDSDEVEPFKPSILPLYPSSTAHSSTQDDKNSSGCGMVIHLRAAPRPKLGIWTGCTAASSDVVPLDASYFETREAAKFVRNSCGCVKEGIGCAVCGNPLGTRYIPCKSAADSFFCARTHEKINGFSFAQRGPDNPQYCSTQVSDHAIYTFFRTAVTSTPTYEFTQSKTRVRPRVHSDISLYSEASLDILSSPPLLTQELGMEFFQGDYEEDSPIDVGEWQTGSPNLTPRPDGEIGNTILDRFSASSPQPLQDLGEDTYMSSSYPRVHARAHVRRPRMYPPGSMGDENVAPIPPPIPVYQQREIVGAWEREREQDRQNNRHWPRGNRGVDLDGDAVWGYVLPDDADVNLQDPEALDKANERFPFPDR